MECFNTKAKHCAHTVPVARAQSKMHKCILQAHVKAVERGHPLAAQRAAASRPASPLLFPSAHPSMYQPFSGPMGGYAHGLSGEAAPMGAQSWGGVDGMGKNAPEKIRVYSPSGSKGLDSIGQALSAALKVGCVCSTSSTALKLRVVRGED